VTFAQYLATAPPDEFFWWSAVPAALAAAGFVASFVFVHRTRLIEDMPTSRLRSAAQGYIEVEGLAAVMDGPAIVCPLTSTRCVWWRYAVERRESRTDRDGRTRTSWVTVDAGVSDDCFLLDDGTGRCVVDPAGARVIPAVRRRWYGHARRPDVGPGHGKGFWRALWCDYRYTEELILPANAVYALGSFRTQSAIEGAFDEKADLGELLGKWKHDKRMMAMLDVNKDGLVDAKEWEAARRMALRKVREEHVARAVDTPDLHVLSRPRHNRPFILSGIPQAAIIRRYRRYAAGSIGTMAATGVFFLWALHQRGLLG
jgi:hypothetical protein